MKWLQEAAENREDVCSGDDLWGYNGKGYWCVDVAPDGTAYTYWHVMGTEHLPVDELPDREAQS